ncbi:MAG: TIGR03086 family metal-binding protein [Streptosporangiaceae bacterium]
MTQITDPRELHQRAMAQTESIVAAVEPDQLTLPTPCTEFDVRELLSHVVGGLNRIAIMGEGGDALAVEPRADGVPDDGWPAAYRAASSRARAAWADDATLDALVEAPWGKVPGRIAHPIPSHPDETALSPRSRVLKARFHVLRRPA